MAIETFSSHLFRNNVTVNGIMSSANTGVVHTVGGVTVLNDLITTGNVKVSGTNVTVNNGFGSGGTTIGTAIETGGNLTASSAVKLGHAGSGLYTINLTSTTLGFFGTTPKVKHDGTSDIKQQFIDYGLLSTGIANLNLGAGEIQASIAYTDLLATYSLVAYDPVTFESHLDVLGDLLVNGSMTGVGSGLTNLNASNLATGTVPTARLGSGTASSSTFLSGTGWTSIIDGGNANG